MRRRDGSGQRGAAAVEVALLMPVFLLLVFGIIEFGIAFNRWISVTHSAREGVRQMSIGRAPAEAESAAENASPDIAGSVDCTGSRPASQEVAMECSTEYDLNLFVVTRNITLSSTATMRAE